VIEAIDVYALKNRVGELLLATVVARVVCDNERRKPEKKTRSLSGEIF
jgi:hypothetical protein